MTTVRGCSILCVCFWSGCGICAVSPCSLSIDTTTIKTMISVNSTSISGVTLICGPDGPPPAIENAIESSLACSLARACLQHQTPGAWAEFPRDAVFGLDDGLRGGRQIRWRLRRIGGCRHWWIQHCAQRGIARRKEINRIGGKEHDDRDGDQRDQIQENGQKNTADDDRQRDGVRVPGKAGAFTGEHRKNTQTDRRDRNHQSK